MSWYLLILNFDFFSAIQCENDELLLSCPFGSAISIHSSNYGRLDKKICSKEHPQKLLDSESCFGDDGAAILKR